MVKKDDSADTAVQKFSGSAVKEGAAQSERPGSARKVLVFSLRATMQIIIALAVLFGSVRFLDYMVDSRRKLPTRPQRERSYTVDTQTLEIGDNRPSLSLYGEVVSERVVDLRSYVAGEIASVSPKLKVGLAINESEQVVAIDDFAYQGAVVEAQVNLDLAKDRMEELENSIEFMRENIVTSEMQLDLAEKDLERARLLVEAEAMTARAFDDRTLTVSQRRQSLEQLKSNLLVELGKITQQESEIELLGWELKQAERDLENTKLNVPFDAVVRESKAGVGRLVGVSDVLATLYDRNALEVRFTLADEQFGRLISETGSLEGKEIEVIWNLGDQPISYGAHVDRVGADVASDRGGIDVYAKIQAKEGELLRPGAFVQIRIPDIIYSGSVVVPEESIYDASHVFVRSEDCRMVRRDVRIHAYDGGDVIVSGDLENGDDLIVTHIAEAGEGLLVKKTGQYRGPIIADGG